MNIEVFKKFASSFPKYYQIKNPGFILMTKYYIRKPTFKYLWFLFFKDPLRILANFFIYVIPIIIKEFISKLFNKKQSLYSDIDKDQVINYFSKGQGFITISYCQKPQSCPDGRFSTKCSASHQFCSSCFLANVKTKADQLNLDFYIVLGDYDSVWNILKNQFFKRKKGVYILTVCNMVMNVIKYLSPLFGFKCLIIPFIKGECKTLAAYELSEFGYKNVQTDISTQNKSLLIEILNKSIEKKMMSKIKIEGGVYENLQPTK
ncbi:MAG: hypothetical protein N2169_01565 [bacterium]|nr:hypothetical protein [bacterium]